MFLNNNFNGIIPNMDLKDEDKNFIALVNRELKSFVDNMEKIRYLSVVSINIVH